MKIKEIENKGLKRAYEVVVPAADLEKEIEVELRNVGKKVKMPGFRPGKVPTQVLKQRYGKSVMGEVLQRAADGAAKKVVTDKKETPALQPKVEITAYDEGEDLALSISYEVMPDMPSIDFSKITIERPTFDISESEIEQSLEMLAERNRTMKDKAKTAKAEAGDIAVIDFKGFIGDEAFAGGEAEGYSLELGSGQFIPGFEDQVMGKKAGDAFDVKVPFPKDYHKEDLAGKEARFEVTLHGLQTPQKAEINDDLATALGLKDLAELKEKIKEQLESDYGTVVRGKLKKQLFDALEPQCKFDVPESMVEMEFDSIWQQHEDAKKRGMATDEGPEKELKAEYQGIAKRRVTLGIFLSNVARDQKIEVGQQELLQAVQQQAMMYPGQEGKIIEFYQQNPEHVNELRGPILEEKAVDYVLTQVKTKDTKTTVEELLAEEEGEAKPAKKSSAKKPAAKKAAPKKEAAKKAPAKKPAAKKPAAKKTTKK